MRLACSLRRLPSGTIGLSLAYLFRCLAARGQPHAVRLSMLELYNEQLRDLLAATAGWAQPQPLQLVDDPSIGIRVQGLTGAWAARRHAASDESSCCARASHAKKTWCSQRCRWTRTSARWSWWRTATRRAPWAPPRSTSTRRARTPSCASSATCSCPPMRKTRTATRPAPRHCAARRGARGWAASRAGAPRCCTLWTWPGRSAWRGPAARACASSKAPTSTCRC